MKNKGHNKTIIFLTGFMGSGKSTVGPIFANTIGYQFVDLDALIEQKEGKKIGAIFAAEGEKKFRALERETLQELLHSESTVISLGGGTVTHPETLAMVKKNGVLIYLRSDVEHIYRRLRTKSDRPMLRNDDGVLLDGDDLIRKIETLLNSRTPFYEQADIIVTTDNKKIGHTIDELAKKIAAYIEQ
jgi:shikimate kinase